MPVNASLARQQWERYTYIRDTSHLAYVEKSRRCENLFSGEHYDEADKAALREARRPGLTINKTLGTLSSIMGEQIDLRTEQVFKPSHGAPSGNADKLTKVFKHISDKNQLEHLRSELFADGAITSRGYIDVRMNFDSSVTGDVEYSILNPRNVMPDPDASEYDPDRWNDVIITKWMTVDDIEYMYNAEDAKALRTKGSSAYAYGYDSIDTLADRFSQNTVQTYDPAKDAVNTSRIIRVIERQYKKLTKVKYFVHMRTGERKEIPHTWDDNKIAKLAAQHPELAVDEHIGKRIRWTVTADDYVLHDEWSPYKHFTVVPYFPYFRYGRTIGLVENLIDPQELLNKSTSSELHAITTMANSGYIVKTGALVNMTPDELEILGAKSGIVIEVNGDVNTSISKITPNQVPQGLSDLSRKGEDFIKKVSMRGDAQTGMARADVSADQIDAQNAHGDVGLRKPLQNLAHSDYILTRNTLDLVQEFYTDPRILTITGSGPAQDTEDVQINWPDPDTGEIMNDLSMGEYTIVIVNQKARQTLDESQFEQAMILKKECGVNIPDEFMIENSNLMNKTDMIKAIRAAAESETAQMQKKMEIMGAQLQLAELKAQVGKEEADATLKRAKAAHTLAQTQTEAAGDPQGQAEMDLKEREHQQEMAHDKQKHDQEMAIEREKHAHEIQMKTAQAEDDRRLKRAQAIAAMRQPAAGAKPSTKVA